MNIPLDRRSFCKTTAQLLAAAALPALGADNENSKPARSLRKGIMYATIGVKGTVMEKFKAVKEAGFAGIEPMSHMKQEEVLEAREATGLELPSVCCATHWNQTLSHPDAAVREQGLDGLKQALRDAKRYGATSVLLVPAVVNKQVSYADAYSRSQEEIRKALPLAEEAGVVIALENVWNKFLLSPLEAARYVDEFHSRWVGWHFDVGNVIKDGWPEQWIRVLGKRIQKLHIKEFSRAKMDKEGPGAGFGVGFLEGDNDWPAVMKALDEVGYRGWGIAEQGGGNTSDGLRNLSSKMDRIFAS